MATILRETDRETFFSALTKGWVINAMSATNPSVRGFAFEQYAIATLARHPSKIAEKLDRVDIEHFDGDVPPKDLNDKGAVLYIPKRWNYKHIDCLLRSVVLEDVKQTKKGFKKQKTEVQKLFLFPIQITLAELNTHSRSLELFHQDAKSWRCEGDPQPTVCFVWVTNRSQDAVKTLPSATYNRR